MPALNCAPACRCTIRSRTTASVLQQMGWLIWSTCPAPAAELPARCAPPQSQCCGRPALHLQPPHPGRHTCATGMTLMYLAKANLDLIPARARQAEICMVPCMHGVMKVHPDQLCNCTEGATWVRGQEGAHQTGMRWPHQSWRLMHQSWMFSSHWLYVRSKRSGRIRISLLATACRVHSTSTLAQRSQHLSHASKLLSHTTHCASFLLTSVHSDCCFPGPMFRKDAILSLACSSSFGMHPLRLVEQVCA